MLLRYSTQHAGDVYQFLHMKINNIIYSRDVQWLVKLWHEFYHIPNLHSTEEYYDPFDDYIEEPDSEQESENNLQETEQMPAIIEETDEHEDEPIATRTCSHDEEPIARRTRSQQDLSELARVANVKIGTNMNEWLNEIAFITIEMSD